MLYNELQKREFIKFYTKNESVATKVENIFKRIGEVENKFQKDMCFMTDKDQITEVVGVVSGNKSRGTELQIAMLRQYIKWCKNRYDNVSNLINDIGSSDVNMEYIYQHMVGDPVDMKSYLDSFLRSDDDKTMDIVYKCVMWLAFAGVDEEKIINIKSTEIDFSDTVDEFFVICDDKEYPIPKIALNTFVLCVNLKEFQHFNANYVNGSTWRKRIEGDQLLRGVKAISKSGQRLSDKVSKKAKARNTERRINYTNAVWSGFFYRLYKRENGGIGIDFNREVQNFIGDREFKLDKTRATLTSVKNQIARDTKTDYELWKKVFKK